MQKGHNLQFDCPTCNTPVQFSIFAIEESDGPIKCTNCQKQYRFDDNTLRRQLRKFEALCRQLIESEEILGSTSVGVDVEGKHVKIPYKLLLTRLNSSIDLMVGDQPISIVFRLEPGQDLPKTVEEI